MQALFERAVCCPYCGEWMDSLIDITAVDGEYIEDCQVCCRPVVFRVEMDVAGEVTVVVRREDETL